MRRKNTVSHCILDFFIFEISMRSNYIYFENNTRFELSIKIIFNIQNIIHHINRNERKHTNEYSNIINKLLAPS